MLTLCQHEFATCQLGKRYLSFTFWKMYGCNEIRFLRWHSCRAMRCNERLSKGHERCQQQLPFLSTHLGVNKYFAAESKSKDYWFKTLLNTCVIYNEQTFSGNITPKPNMYVANFIANADSVAARGQFKWSTDLWTNMPCELFCNFFIYTLCPSQWPGSTSLPA